MSYRNNLRFGSKLNHELADKVYQLLYQQVDKKVCLLVLVGMSQDN